GPIQEGWEDLALELPAFHGRPVDRLEPRGAVLEPGLDVAEPEVVRLHDVNVAVHDPETSFGHRRTSSITRRGASPPSRTSPEEQRGAGEAGTRRGTPMRWRRGSSPVARDPGCRLGEARELGEGERLGATAGVDTG